MRGWSSEVKEEVVVKQEPREEAGPGGKETEFPLATALDVAGPNAPENWAELWNGIVRCPGPLLPCPALTSGEQDQAEGGGGCGHDWVREALRGRGAPRHAGADTPRRPTSLLI